ncbi:hypothetical protein RUND412_000627 [Rhizina undulata]
MAARNGFSIHSKKVSISIIILTNPVNNDRDTTKKDATKAKVEEIPEKTRWKLKRQVKFLPSLQLAILEQCERFVVFMIKRFNIKAEKARKAA